MRKRVLWGHDSEDYREMFDLTQEDLHSSILEYGCGPSAFNVQQTLNQHRIVSCDPLFVLDKDTLSSKASMIFANTADEIEKDYSDFSHKGSLEQLIADRKKGMNLFFEDYHSGKEQGRYMGVTDDHLPFKDFSFDFALVSHYLFEDLYDQTVEFHLAVIRELARVAKEVRIFPLTDRHSNTSEFLGPVLLGLQQENYGVEVREVPFHFHHSGNAMLRVWAQHCMI